MTLENTTERLLDHNKHISYSQRVAIVDLLESLKNCDNCKPKNGDNSCKECKRDSFRMHDNNKDNWRQID